MILLPRETPMSLPQLRNMVLCAEAGAMLMPAMPAFYQMPKTLDDLADFMAGQDPRRARLRARALSGVEGMTSVPKDTVPHRRDVRRDRAALRPAQSRAQCRARSPMARSCRRRAGLAPGRARARSLHRDGRSRDRDRPARARVVGASASISPARCSRLGLAKVVVTWSATARFGSSAATRPAFLWRARPAMRPRSRSASGTSRSPSARWLKLPASCGRTAGSPSSSSVSPRIPGLRSLYSWYFRYVLPAIGRLVSKHTSAYSYLPASVGTFPPPDEFAGIIARQGFSKVTAVPLTFGIVYLYIADKS